IPPPSTSENRSVPSRSIVGASARPYPCASTSHSMAPTLECRAGQGGRMTLETVEADTPASEVAGALRRDGAVVVHDLLPPAVLHAINTEVDPYVETADPDIRHLNPGVQFFHAQTRHVNGLAGKSRTFATEVMVHPLLLGLCDEILGPACARYQLNLAHLIDRLPGATNQFWHQDELVWNLVPEPKPELQLASVIALVDFTADNGATRVFPGSNHWEQGRY